MGRQDYGNAVTLGADTTLSTTTPNGLVVFRSPVDSDAAAARSLTVTTIGGNISFLAANDTAAIGRTNPLSTLTLNSDPF